MKFNMEPSLGWIEAYLDGAEPYDEVHAMLLLRGVESVGLPPSSSGGRGSFVGVCEREF